MTLDDLNAMKREADSELNLSRQFREAAEKAASLRGSAEFDLFSELITPHSTLRHNASYGSDEKLNQELKAVLNEIAKDILCIAEYRLEERARTHKTNAAVKNAVIKAAITPRET